MNFTTHCTECGLTVVVVGGHEEVRRLFRENTYPCVRDGCGGVAHRVEGPLPGGDQYAVSAHEYYQGIHGLGMQLHSEASPENVEALLTGQRIVSIVVEPANNEGSRTLLWALRMEDGNTLHLAHSGKGPCAYRIEKTDDKV